MDTANLIIEMLEKNKGEYISGSLIAKEVGVSRAAICKNIKLLKKEGIDIESKKNKGYKLSFKSDLLNKNIIQNIIQEKCDIQIFSKIDSTNTKAKKEALITNESMVLIISDTQTNGYGRNGKTFYSPKEGLYMSLLLKKENIKKNINLITMIAANSIVSVLKEKLKIETKIKWVNDIFYKDKKISGILTEGKLDFETGNYEWVVIGIGINISLDKENVPHEIKDIIGDIKDDNLDNKNKITRNILAGSITKNILKTLKNENKEEIINKYRENNFLIGKEVEIHRNNKNENKKETETVFVIDIDSDGRLFIKNEKGEFETLCSGEISLKRFS